MSQYHNDNNLKDYSKLFTTEKWTEWQMIAEQDSANVVESMEKFKCHKIRCKKLPNGK